MLNPYEILETWHHEEGVTVRFRAWKYTFSDSTTRREEIEATVLLTNEDNLEADILEHCVNKGFV